MYIEGTRSFLYGGMTIETLILCFVPQPTLYSYSFQEYYYSVCVYVCDSQWSKPLRCGLDFRVLLPASVSVCILIAIVSHLVTFPLVFYVFLYIVFCKSGFTI